MAKFVILAVLSLMSVLCLNPGKFPLLYNISGQKGKSLSIFADFKTILLCSDEKKPSGKTLTLFCLTERTKMLVRLKTLQA